MNEAENIKWRHSAGIRNQIFAPMVRNADGHYEVDGSFISGNEQIKCDAEFTSRVYDKVEKYIISVVHYLNRLDVG